MQTQPRRRFPAKRIARALTATTLSLALAFTSAAFAQTIKDGGDLRAALTGEPAGQP